MTEPSQNTQALHHFQERGRLINKQLMDLLGLSGTAGMKVAARAAHSLSLAGLVTKNKPGDHTITEKGKAWDGPVKSPKVAEFRKAAELRKQALLEEVN
jgi:hypothetical protein